MKNTKKYIYLCLLLVFIFLTSCKSESKAPTAIEKNQMIEFATRIDLFNQIEDAIKNIQKLEYTSAEEKLTEIYQLTNESGISIEKLQPEGSIGYIDNLENFSESVTVQSKQQKSKEIIYAVQKQDLKLIASMASQGQNQDQSGGQESGGSSESSSSSESGGSKSGDSSSSESSGSSTEAPSDSSSAEQQDLIIPEEEITKKYPEIIIAEKDYIIMQRAIHLLDYITVINLDYSKDNVQALTQRLKYLIYQVNISSLLKDYLTATERIIQAKNILDNIILVTNNKDPQQILSMTTALKNLASAVSNKEIDAIKIQSENIIKETENLEKNK